MLTFHGVKFKMLELNLLLENTRSLLQVFTWVFILILVSVKLLVSWTQILLKVENEKLACDFKILKYEWSLLHRVLFSEILFLNCMR